LLWITNQPNHTMQWDSPWGKGFPGWHIECTAMSTKYLGENFDIHTGGKEHIPVHHTNEIAQGFGAFGHETANFWLHNDWLSLKGEKMSKSLGNVITAQGLIEKGFDPLALRYLILNSNYRQGMQFDFEALEGAQNAYNKLKTYVTSWKDEGGRETISEDIPDKITFYHQQFIDGLNNDLNIPQALAVVWQMVKSDLPSPDKLDLIMEFDQVLGLDLLKVSKEEKVSKVSKEVNELVSLREEARIAGNWEKADNLRLEIKNKGYLVEDTKDGSKITKI
jgi:cysteinyl-tRNA synthetase